MITIVVSAGILAVITTLCAVIGLLITVISFLRGRK